VVYVLVCWKSWLVWRGKEKRISVPRGVARASLYTLRRIRLSLLHFYNICGDNIRLLDYYLIYLLAIYTIIKRITDLFKIQLAVYTFVLAGARAYIPRRFKFFIRLHTILPQKLLSS